MSPLLSLQDEVCIPSTSASASSDRNPLLIYFICGNPGLIEYYRGFLQHLYDSLSPEERAATTIFGASHDGFELDPSSQVATAHGHEPPFALEEIIEGTKRKLTQKAKELQPKDGKLRVILTGHSLGSYMILEVLSWWQSLPPSQQTFDIVAGMPLFPTILHIAKSSKGRTLAPILSLPGLPIMAQFLARLLAFVPLWLWNWPKTMTPGEKRPEHTAATEAVLRSEHGAKQVVYLANDEMKSIKEDKWHPERLWGVVEHEIIASSGDDDEERLIDTSEFEFVRDESKEGPRTKLFFYWGDDDYWVDNRIRDKFIAQRAKREDDKATMSWPEMIIDRNGMDHCFSLSEEHSKIVARQVAKWVASLKGDA